jgi:hypothetical protein
MQLHGGREYSYGERAQLQNQPLNKNRYLRPMDDRLGVRGKL